MEFWHSIAMLPTFMLKINTRKYLYYNPYKKDTTVTCLSGINADLYDIVSKKYLAKGANGKISMKLPAGEAALVVILPSGTKLTSEGSKIKAGNVVISYK